MGGWRPPPTLSDIPRQSPPPSRGTLRQRQRLSNLSGLRLTPFSSTWFTTWFIPPFISPPCVSGTFYFEVFLQPRRMLPRHAGDRNIGTWYALREDQAWTVSSDPLKDIRDPFRGGSYPFRLIRNRPSIRGEPKRFGAYPQLAQYHCRWATPFTPLTKR